MLKPAWYLLTERDWFAELAVAPRLADRDEDLVEQLGDLFCDESYFTSAKTVATVRVMLLAAEHLGDNLTYIPDRHDLADMARLIAGLNLVQAHLTQIMQRTAEHVGGRRSPAFADLPAGAVQAVTANLNQAGASGEICAGYLKEADFALRAASK